MSALDTSLRWLASAVLRYRLAVSCVVAALLVAELLQHLIVAPPLYEFLAGVLVSTWVGGLGPGILVVMLSRLAIDYFFVPTLHTFSLDIAYLPGLIGFGLSALLSSWLTTKRKRAKVSLRQARDELEARVQERTAELQRTNATLYTEIAKRKRAEETLRAQANLSGRWEGELIHTGGNGRRIVVANGWALERDEQGRPVAALELNNDITARKRAEGALHQAQAELAALRRRYDALTPRERDVMQCVVAGMLNKQSAAELGTSEITVKIHRGQVMPKMGSGSV
jgi:DNA-binding CsgD family transcriptional regulator